MKRILFASALALSFSAVLKAQNSEAPAPFRLGQEVTIEGKTFHFLKKTDENLIFTPPQPLTAQLGAFITPVEAKVSDFQANTPRTGATLINGSGWGELWPRSGVYVHKNSAYASGASMWNTGGSLKTGWVSFDLGKEYNVAGIYAWNYNEAGQWLARGIKEAVISSSNDGEKWAPIGTFTFARASGTDDYKGDAVPFEKPVKTRYFRFDIKSNHGGDMVGLSEIRFANADEKATLPPPWTPKYPRPQHPKLTLGQPLNGAENIIFPADMGVIDVTKAPYNAKGDGVTDDTAAIQKALSNHPAQGAIIYLPNGVYLLSDTLKWPAGTPGRSDYKQTTLQGQSRSGTILKLKDSCPAFENVLQPRPVIWTGPAPAQRFGNEVRNVTVDTGLDNPGAAGLHFMASNQGGIYDVTVISGDGQGVAGVDFGYTDENGPLFVKNLKVVGFDFGIATGHTVNSQTLENIEIENQNVAGVRNGGQVLNLRHLKSQNSVTALVNNGTTVLLDSELHGTNNQGAAITNESALMARNVKVSGYATSIENRAADEKANEKKGETKTVTGSVDFFQFPAPRSLFDDKPTPLNLPVQETPDVPWDDLQNWASPQQFGAKADDKENDSDAIQKAIDSGRTTIYLPRGTYLIDKTIIIRGKVRRIIGGKAHISGADPLRGQNAPVFRFEDGEAPAVSIERINTDYTGGPLFFAEHAAARALILRQIGINFNAGKSGLAYRNSGTGPLFVEDVVGGTFEIKNQNVWARQLNLEPVGPHLLNDGGQVWILGLKTERPNTIVETKNGGKTQIMGGLIYNTGGGDQAPMLINRDSQMSSAIAEVCYQPNSYRQLIVETRGGQTKEWRVDTPFRGKRLVFYESGK